MLRSLLRRIIGRNRDIILHEARFINGFLHILFKRRNTGEKWSGGEKKQLRRGVKHLSACIPILLVFMLPGGMLLLPILVNFLDRRYNSRSQAVKQAAESID